jgi:hypothetical protein
MEQGVVVLWARHTTLRPQSALLQPHRSLASLIPGFPETTLYSDCLKDVCLL